MSTPKGYSTWAETKAKRREIQPVDESRIEELRDEMIAAERAYRLAEIRKEQHVTQKQIADRMHVSQPRISDIEKGKIDRTEVGTLAAYVEALGGKVKVVAEFGDQALTIA